MSRYVDALISEIDKSRDFFKDDVLDTIYFGGGTPSLLTDSQVAMVVDKISGVWGIENVDEFTIEANPDDVTYDWMKGLRSIGVNRLSMGVQSFDDKLLRWMNRRHDAATAIDAVETIYRAGVDNISVDLMFGLPGQSVEGVGRDVEMAASLPVSHISAYQLMMESERLCRMVDDGSVKLPTDDESAAMYDTIWRVLESAGFEQYEISNYARQGRRSKHNSAYWHQVPYLGIGAGAVSFDGRQRWSNIDNVVKYIESGDDVASVRSVEILTRHDLYNEYLFTALRTCEGIDLADCRKRWGVDAVERLMLTSKKYLDADLLSNCNDMLALTRKGVFVSDGIMSDIMID